MSNNGLNFQKEKEQMCFLFNLIIGFHILMEDPQYYVLLSHPSFLDI